MGNKRRPKRETRRRYTKKRRADQEEQTREAIVKAAVALHQSEGGGAKISAIARRAGVARVTVYRHFPDELALLTACTNHYLSLHPPPDIESWAAISDPVERLRTGLTETYAYHRVTEKMMTVAEREVSSNPVLAEILEPLNAYWASAKAVLAKGWNDGEDEASLVEAAIGLALSLPAWRILTHQQGLDDSECVTLFVGTIHHMSSG